MGKETKIGLTVILVLLVGLGVVVANRLSTPAEDPLASAATDPKEEKSDATTEKNEAKKDAVKVLPKSPKKTTVVASKDTSRASKGSSSVASRWSVASDKDNGAASAASLMPKPPTPVTASSRYGNTAGASQANALRPTSNPLYSASQTRGYTQGRTSPTAVNTAPAPPVPGGATIVSRNSQRVAQRGYGRAGSGGYSSDGYSSSGYSSSRYAGSGATTYAGRSTYGQGRSSATGPVQQYPAGQYSSTGRSGSSVTTTFGTQTRGENGEYEVQPNDNYWVISEKIYGSGSYFKALAEHNSRKYPKRNQLKIGDTIIAPSLSQLEETYPDLVPKPSRREIVQNRNATVSLTSQYSGGKTYVVEEGDTLSDIARYELGKASRWVEIYELNRNKLGKDFDYLVPGTSLVMPGDDVIQRSGDVLTRRPGAVYHR